MSYALGGGELSGDRLVKMVYVDEAGISNPKHEPYVIVSGVIVDADKKMLQARGLLDAVVEKHIPQEYRDGFVFHATELFNGGGKVFTRDHPDWPLSKRLEIADDLAKIPRKLQLPIALGWVDRAENATLFPAANTHEQTLDAHILAFARCELQVDTWMRTNAPNEICMVIVEDSESARSLIRATHNFYQDKGMVGLTQAERSHLPFRSIMEDPLFQGKRPSSILQLADFCAYVFKRFLMNQSDERYLRFWKPMRDLATFFPLENKTGLKRV